MIEIRWASLKESKPDEYLIRFAFGGICTVAAGLVAKHFGPSIGGLFLAFPAIFPAGISLVEKHECQRKQEIGADGTKRGRTAAAIDAAGAAIGAISLALFGLTVSGLVERRPAALVLAAASLCWLACALLLWELRKRRFFARGLQAGKPRN